MARLLTGIPGRTPDERAFNGGVLVQLSYVYFSMGCPLKGCARAENRFLEQLYYRAKWRKLQAIRRRGTLPEGLR